MIDPQASRHQSPRSLSDLPDVGQLPWECAGLGLRGCGRNRPCWRGGGDDADVGRAGASNTGCHRRDGGAGGGRGWAAVKSISGTIAVVSTSGANAAVVSISHRQLPGSLSRRTGDEGQPWVWAGRLGIGDKRQRIVVPSRSLSAHVPLIVPSKMSIRSARSLRPPSVWISRRSRMSTVSSYVCWERMSLA